MQEKMKIRQMSGAEIEIMLRSENVGRIGTLDSLESYPYIVPVHYAYFNNKIYVHGLSKGQKIENIKADSRVCFEVDSMSRLIMHNEPCKVSTVFESVIIKGVARLIEEVETKKLILTEIVRKYTPSLSQQAFSEKMLAVTSIIEIEIESRTGKCNKPDN